MPKRPAEDALESASEVFVREHDGMLRDFHHQLGDDRSGELDDDVLKTLKLSRDDYWKLKLRLGWGIRGESDLASESSQESLLEQLDAPKRHANGPTRQRLDVRERDPRSGR
jgi:hypothetical protein